MTSLSSSLPPLLPRAIRRIPTLGLVLGNGSNCQRRSFSTINAALQQPQNHISKATTAFFPSKHAHPIQTPCSNSILAAIRSSSTSSRSGVVVGHSPIVNIRTTHLAKSFFSMPPSSSLFLAIRSKSGCAPASNGQLSGGWMMNWNRQRQLLRSPFHPNHHLALCQSLPPGGVVVGTPTRTFASQKHKRIIRHAKGYRGRSKNCFTIAIRRVEKGWEYAYRDRRRKHREWRKLWIQRLQAGCRQYGWSYSRLIPALSKSGIVLNRKVLAEMAANEPFAFKSIIDVVNQLSPQPVASIKSRKA